MVAAIDREQSNSSVIVDNKYVVKILRQVTPGIHPEIEVGRFLADRAFPERAGVTRHVELVEGDTHRVRDRPCFIQNQGDAWSVTSAGLDRLHEELRCCTDAIRNLKCLMLQRMRQIGRRTAEMHRALARNQDRRLHARTHRREAVER